jgi:hypothetical protein
VFAGTKNLWPIVDNDPTVDSTGTSDPEIVPDVKVEELQCLPQWLWSTMAMRRQSIHNWFKQEAMQEAREWARTSRVERH